MSAVSLKIKKVFVLYWMFWLVYGLLPGLLLYWVWKNWSPNLHSLSNEDIKYARNIAIILGVSYWVVSLVLWVLAGYVSLIWFMQKCDSVNNFEAEEKESVFKAGLNNKVQNPEKLINTNKQDEKLALRSDSKSYNSVSENNKESYDSYITDLQRKRLAFQRAKSETLNYSQDMWEDDILKLPSDPNISTSASSSQTETDRRSLFHSLSRDESLGSLVEVKPFNNYLHLATIDSPLTARELFFIDLIRIADERERLEALEQLDQGRRPSIELLESVGAFSRDKRDSDYKLETIHEVKSERDSCDEKSVDEPHSSVEGSKQIADDKFFPVSSESLEEDEIKKKKSKKK